MINSAADCERERKACYVCKRRCDQKEFVASVENKTSNVKKENKVVTQKLLVMSKQEKAFRSWIKAIYSSCFKTSFYLQDNSNPSPRTKQRASHINLFQEKKQPLVFLRAMMRVENRRGKRCVSKGKRKDSISGASMEYIIVNQAKHFS